MATTQALGPPDHERAAATHPPVTAVDRDRLRRYWLTVLIASCGSACHSLQ